MNISVVVDGCLLCVAVISDSDLKYRTATEVHSLMCERVSNAMAAFFSESISLANVPSDLSLLAFGAEGAEAASVTKVPKGQGLGRLAR